MQEKGGSSLLMLLLDQFHRRKKELFLFFGEIMLKPNLGNLLFGDFLNQQTVLLDEL